MADHENKTRAVAQALTSGGMARGIVPQNFDDCYRIAKLLAQTQMVPKDYQGQPEAACVAIMQGLEIGLPPLAALQSIAVINGRPSLWGDGALGVVKSSGLCEWIKEYAEGTTENPIAVCETKRKGDPEPVKRTFSQADAQKAGLLKVRDGKQPGPWHTYPGRMRQMRARSWAIRDCYPDVLKGLHIVEEAQDIPPMKDVTPRVLAKTIGMDEGESDGQNEKQMAQPPTPPQETAQEMQPEAKPKPKRTGSAEGKRDGSVKRFNALRAEIAKCQGAIECKEIWDKNTDLLNTLPGSWFDTLAEEYTTKMSEYGVEIEIEQQGSLRMS